MSAADGKANPEEKDRTKSRSDISSSQRTRKGKKYNLRVSKTAAVWEDIHLRGEVEIGDRTVIGPGCVLYAKNAPIKIGSENVLTENVHIINKSTKTMVIGDQNIFETNCKIEARRIGDLNLFGAKCVVMSEVAVGSGCVVTPKVQVINRKELRDGTVMFGYNFSHRQSTVRKRTALILKRCLKSLRKAYNEKNGRSILKKPKRDKKRARKSKADGRSRPSEPPQQNV